MQATRRILGWCWRERVLGQEFTAILAPAAQDAVKADG